MPPPETDSVHDQTTQPIPDTPLDLGLLLTALRRTIVLWRERASAAPEREARIYHQAEKDLSAVISGHAEMRSAWTAARRDLVQAIMSAMAERDGRWS